MKIFIDYRELNNHSEFKEIFELLEIEYVSTTLSVADIVCNNVLIEHKAYTDYVNSIKNDLLFKQIQDMKSNNNFIPYILVSCRIKDILMVKDGMSRNELFGSIASIFVRGVPVFFCESIENMVYIMIKLFEKHSDNKNRVVNPQRRQVSTENQMATTYGTLPNVGPTIAERIREQFPTIEKLNSATVKQLKDIQGVGTKRAKKIFAYIHGVEQ